MPVCGVDGDGFWFLISASDERVRTACKRISCQYIDGAASDVCEVQKSTRRVQRQRRHSAACNTGTCSPDNCLISTQRNARSGRKARCVACVKKVRKGLALRASRALRWTETNRSEVYSSLWETYRRATERHLPSQSVTCSPTQVNAPRLNSSQTGRYSTQRSRLLELFCFSAPTSARIVTWLSGVNDEVCVAVK